LEEVAITLGGILEEIQRGVQQAQAPRTIYRSTPNCQELRPLFTHEEASVDHNRERLANHILPLSVATDFDTARTEWALIGVEVSEEFDSCSCGQDIKEHCYIRNQINGTKTYVGNVCINRFIGIETGNLFAGLRRIAEDDTANANEDLIYHAFKLGYIFDQEYKFLMDTRRKRNLSPKQVAWKQKINRRIINQAVVQRRSST
jgi:hypothetical protein